VRLNYSWKYAEEALNKVSRTFALNIRVLKENLRKPILLAYLYMRIADTIEDDAELPVAEKRILLKKFSQALNLGGESIDKFVEALPQSWKNSEREDRALCSKAGVVIPLLSEYAEPVANAVKRSVEEMSEGMAEFSELSIESEADLDRYCYFVAGLVGNMLTELFSISGKFSEERQAKLRKLSVSFGLALQLVNIIKDIQEDSLRKVCYVPKEFFRRHGINSVQEFFSPQTPQQNKNAVIDELIKKAKKHLLDAKNYIKILPRLQHRMRLFCLWPSLMAADNLRVITEGGTKITRKTVKRIIRHSTMLGWSNSWIEREFSKFQICCAS